MKSPQLDPDGLDRLGQSFQSAGEDYGGLLTVLAIQYGKIIEYFLAKDYERI